MSRFARNPEDEIWYVHAPLKNEKREIVHAPPPSNIPYLNGVMDPEEDGETKQPVVWFKDTDSEFIKLSKLGGRQDLLIHKPYQTSKQPVGYPRPEWWTDMLIGNNNEPADKEKDSYVFTVPEWFAHQEKPKVKNTFEQNTNNQSDISNQIPKYEPRIEEPLKYGQLRNYMHPVKVNVNQNTNVPASSGNTRKNEKYEDPTTMPKILANFYSSDRPKNYEEWKTARDNNEKPTRRSQINKK